MMHEYIIRNVGTGQYEVCYLPEELPVGATVEFGNHEWLVVASGIEEAENVQRV